MIEILCGVLTGAGIADGVHSMFKDFDNPSNTGHLFMALDIEQLFGREDYDERIAYLCATIRASGPEAALPGERRWAELAHNQVAGVLIDDRMKKTLTDLGIDLKVALPWD
jgi:LDH2 family malate/lactate/ureidoglycolate dehydrogenase